MNIDGTARIESTSGTDDLDDEVLQNDKPLVLPCYKWRWNGKMMALKSKPDGTHYYEEDDDEVIIEDSEDEHSSNDDKDDKEDGKQKHCHNDKNNDDDAEKNLKKQRK